MKLHDFNHKKQQQSKISVITCYDYPSAKIIAESNIDCVLVGDSVAMTVHGLDSTVMASMEMMILHTESVARGLGSQFLISDMPFLSYRASRANTVQNAKRLIQAGAHALKLEGGDPDIIKTVRHLVASGIPVVGHIGLTPQSVLQLGGYKVQGKEQKQATSLLEQARLLEEAGCCALVIECVPADLAKTITNALSIATIGIGAGVDTSGQVLVWHDLLGLQMEIKPRFVKQFIAGKMALLEAINTYDEQVKSAQFPALEHSY